MSERKSVVFSLTSAKLHTLVWGFVLPGLFLSSAVMAETFPFTARVKVDNVNVRAGQSSNYETIAEINKGEELVVTGKEYSWYKVHLPEGARIYVRKDYVSILSADVGEITADRVNVRARPNTLASILGQLLKGEQVFVRESVNDLWLRIGPLPRLQGWVHEDLLEFKSKSVSAALQQDPSGAAARAKVEKASMERKRALKFAGLKDVAGGIYEVQGVLTPVVNGKDIVYKVLGGEGGLACLAYLEGSAPMLANFSGNRVVVRGPARVDASLDAAVLNVQKIHLSF